MNLASPVLDISTPKRGSEFFKRPKENMGTLQALFETMGVEILEGNTDGRASKTYKVVQKNTQLRHTITHTYILYLYLIFIVSHSEFNHQVTT